MSDTYTYFVLILSLYIMMSFPMEWLSTFFLYVFVAFMTLFLIVFLWCLMFLGTEVVKRNSMLFFLPQQRNLSLKPLTNGLLWTGIGTLCKRIGCLIFQCGTGEQQVQWQVWVIE